MVEDYNKDIETSGETGTKGAGSKMDQMSPEEVRQKAKETVAKGMALGTGSIEGYVQNADPKVVGEAARKVTQTVKETGRAVKDEVGQGIPGEPLFQRKSSAQDLGGISGGEASGPGMKEKVGERISSSAERLKENVSTKTSEMKERSKESFQHMKQEMTKHSPDEIREKARDSVGRVVASGTGALEGVAENADPELPAQAVHKMGETVREAGGAIREEAHKTKDQLKKEGEGPDTSGAVGSNTSSDTSSGGI